MIPTLVRPYREVTSEGKLILNLHKGQTRAWNSKARFVVVLSGTQWGKSCFMPDWLHREILACGEGDYIVGTATFPLLGLKLLPEFIMLFQDILQWGKYKEDRTTTKIIESNHDKSRIIFFSATNPEAIESATAKAAVLDEAGQRQFRPGTWEAVQRRLSLHQGRVLFGTTLYQLGWLKNDVYDRWVAGDKNFDVIQGDSTDNPAFPREEYERQKATMPSWKFDMFYRGRYTRPVGMVYDCFNEADDVVDRFEIPKNWQLHVGHDFGQANPAALFYAESPTGLLYLWHEYLPGPGRSPYDHVQEWKRITHGYNVVTRMGGNWTTEQEIRDAYTAQGWHIQKPKVKEVQTQIERVYGMNKLHKIKVFRDLTDYLDQKATFSYELDEKHQPTDEYENESQMHLLAAERYLMSYFTPETVERANPNQQQRMASNGLLQSSDNSQSQRFDS